MPVDPICDYLRSQGYELLPELYLKKSQADALYATKGSLVTGGVDFTDYYKKSEADLLLSQKIDTILAENTFVKKIDIPDLSNVATKDEVNVKLDKATADNLYQPKGTTTGTTVDVDLSGYYKKEETDNLLNKKLDIDTAETTYAKKVDFDQEIQDRKDADTDLENTKAAKTDLETETTERKAEDTKLETNKADKASLDTEIQDRKDADTKIEKKIDNLKKIYIYANGQAVKQNDLILHAGKVYIVSNDMTLSTWNVDQPNLQLTDSDTISCISYAENIKIEKGQLVIYEKQLYLCDNSIDNTTDWTTDEVHMIQTTTKVDLSEYYNKTETNNLIKEKEDLLKAGDDIEIDKANLNTIKVTSATDANINSIVKRTHEGSINVKMPNDILDDTVINNKKHTEDLALKADQTALDTEKTERTTKDTEIETKIGTLKDLTTTEKRDLVKAINELKASLDQFVGQFAMNNDSIIWTSDEYNNLQTKEDKIYYVKD